MSLLIWTLIFDHLAQLQRIHEKRLGGGSNHGGGMSWGHDPPLSGSVAVQGSGGPFVHRPPIFTGMLTAMAA